MTNTSNATEEPSASLIAAGRELYSMAIHEAGHAVMAYLCGRTIKGMRWKNMSLGGAQVELVPLEGVYEAEDYVNTAAIIAAGPHAEFRLSPYLVPERYIERLKESLLPFDGDDRPYPTLEEVKHLSKDYPALLRTGSAEEGERVAKNALEEPDVQYAIEALADVFVKQSCRLSGKVAERIIKAALN